MEITSSQLAFIREDIRNKGIILNSLADSIVDHICCAIESSTGSDFDAVYSEVISSFGEHGILRIQLETNLLLTIKKEKKMKKAIYLSGFLAAFLCTTGLLFYLFHWKGALTILMVGFLFLNFSFMPLYFLDKYKKSVAETK